MATDMEPYRQNFRVYVVYIEATLNKQFFTYSVFILPWGWVCIFVPETYGYSEINLSSKILFSIGDDINSVSYKRCLEYLMGTVHISFSQFTFTKPVRHSINTTAMLDVMTKLLMPVQNNSYKNSTISTYTKVAVAWVMFFNFLLLQH